MYSTPVLIRFKELHSLPFAQPFFFSEKWLHRQMLYCLLTTYHHSSMLQLVRLALGGETFVKAHPLCIHHSLNKKEKAHMSFKSVFHLVLQYLYRFLEIFLCPFAKLILWFVFCFLLLPVVQPCLLSPGSH